LKILLLKPSNGQSTSSETATFALQSAISRSTGQFRAGGSFLHARWSKTESCARGLSRRGHKWPGAPTWSH